LFLCPLPAALVVQIQIRSGPEGEVLTNEAGEVTSHLQVSGSEQRGANLLDSPQPNHP
jgi:hypothetical protein